MQGEIEGNDWGDLLAMRPEGGFDLGVFDPAWRFKAGITKKAAGSKYRLMDLEQIKQIPVREIMAPNSLVVLWALNPMVPQALGVLEAWGAKFISFGAWRKTTSKGAVAFGPGYWLRCASEPWILAKFGRPKIYCRSVRTIFDGPRRRHSEKPQEAYDHFARLVRPDATKIEVFGRATRQGGWLGFGDEMGILD